MLLMLHVMYRTFKTMLSMEFIFSHPTIRYSLAFIKWFLKNNSMLVNCIMHGGEIREGPPTKSYDLLITWSYEVMYQIKNTIS